MKKLLTFLFTLFMSMNVFAQETSIADKIAEINGTINGFVWGIPMLVLIIGTGIYLTIKTGFFQVTRAKAVMNETFFAIFKNKNVTKNKEKKSISQFQALSTALAATIGTGNIAGVATAITVGGPGAVFWMWVSAFFGMMTNYSENVLGIYFREKNAKGEWSGGAMYYIEKGLKCKWLAVIFATFCVLASFGIGNMTQINSIASSMKSTFGIPTIVTGVVVAVIVAFVIIGGIRRIGQVTEKIVPFMALLYILGALYILFANYEKIPAVFSDIFTQAFGMKSAVGGIAGATVKQAITMGFKRGVFSNEAGLGSSVMVHSASNVKEPVIQGMWGIFEVFADTMIVCTLTAFAILSTDVVGSVDATGAVIEGVPLVTKAFTEALHSFAGVFISVSILLFAFSTILGWSYYGEKSMEYLFGIKATIIYKVIFVLFIVVGATMNLSLAWDIADTLNGLMAIPNLIGVLLLSGTVFKITKNYVERKITKKNPYAEPILSFDPVINAEHKKAIEEE